MNLLTLRRSAIFRQDWMRKRLTMLLVAATLASLPGAVSAADSPASSSAEAAMIRFTAPEPALSTNASVVEVKLHLDGDADPATLNVTANGLNVTNSFDVGTCTSAPCDVVATLTVGSELDFAWNNLLATITAASGAASSDRVQVYVNTGLSDSTNGSSAPYAVHMAMSPTLGIEVDYTPQTGLGPYFYPGDHPWCSQQQLTMIDLNRATLAWKATNCFGPTDNASLQGYLRGLTESDLILGSTGPGASLGALNFRPIGGTDFTGKNALAAYSYSVVGYGQASAGIATESYNTDSTTPWHGLSGNLVNVSPDNSAVFAFQANDPVGFAILPNGKSATIVIGNTKQFPVGNNGGPPNQVVPPGFTSVRYTSPQFAGNGGGIWVLVLDRHTLGLVRSMTFSSQDSRNEIALVQVQTLNGLLSSLDDDKLVFITTLLGPDKSGDYGANPLNTQQNQWDQYTGVLRAVLRMGVSAYAFGKPMGTEWSLLYPASEFSMVGIPNAFGTDFAAVAHPLDVCLAALPPNSTRLCGGNREQWFSSAIDTQQKETGALKGSLVRDRAFEYRPMNVTPFDPGTLGANPTADDLLADNLSQAIATAAPVSWPLTDTPGHKDAYAYISNQLASVYFYGGAGCLAQPSVCKDIRFYYTGSAAAKIANGISPATLSYPGDGVAAANGFSAQDWTDATRQLSLEHAYLGNVLAYQTWLERLNTDSTKNMALLLTAAATDVANELNQNTGQPLTTISNSSVTLPIDGLSTAASLASALSLVVPQASVVSGLLNASAGFLEFVRDAHKVQSEPDPYVNQLGDLLTNNSSNAAKAAVKFNSDLETSTSTFFNSIYSDWFKLQTVGLMTVNPDAPGWYAVRAGSATSAAPVFQASLRKSFYLQTASQYFGTLYGFERPAYFPRGPRVGPIPSLYRNAATLGSVIANGHGLSQALTDYSWWYRDTIPVWNDKSIGDGFWDFNFVVLKSNHERSWTQLGDTLMGPPSANDGTGNLNLNRDVLYDSGIFPTISSLW